MKNVMLDLETLGTSPGSVILSIGAVEFDMAEGLGREFYTVINQMSCLQNGLVTDSNTLAWWAQQSKEARQVLEDSRTSDIKLPDAMHLFNAFLERCGDRTQIRVWGNGADFDNTLMIAAYKATAIKCGWKYHNNRCYRTLKETIGLPQSKREGTHHNALADAKHQATHALKIQKFLSQIVGDQRLNQGPYTPSQSYGEIKNGEYVHRHPTGK